MPFKSEKQRKWMHANNPEMAKKWEKKEKKMKRVKELIKKMVREEMAKMNESKLNEFNKSHFLNLIKQEINSLKGQIAYAKDKVRYKGTPDWEKKEFKAVLKDKIKNLKDTEKHYKRVEKLSEGKLTEKQSAAVQRMAKQGMWVVTDGGRETIKVVKNERAAKMLVKKLKKDKSNRYHNPEAKAIELEGKLTEKTVKNIKGKWEDNFPGFNEKEYKVIAKLIWMNHQGIGGVIKDYRKNKSKWTKWIKQMAKKGLGEGKLTEINLQKVKKLVKKFKIPVVRYKKGQFAPNDVVVKTKGGRLETDKKAIDIFDKSGHHLETYDLDSKDVDKAFQHLKKISEEKLNEAKETIFDVAARVMKDKQAYGYNTKKGLVTVDVQTANLLTKVFKKVNPKMKKILSDLGYKSPTQLMNTLWAVVK